MTNLVEATQKVLGQGKTVLMMGVIPRSLGEWHNVRDSQLLIWGVQDNSAKNVPSKTGLILLSTNMNKGVLDYLKRRMPEGATIYPQPLHVREMKTLLQTVWGPRLQAKRTKGEKMTTTPTTPSDPKKFVATFVAGLPVVQAALDNVLKENARLLEEKAALVDQTAELQLLREELERVNGLNTSLTERLGAAEERAQVAEKTLAEKMRAIQTLFQPTPA